MKWLLVTIFFNPSVETNSMTFVEGYETEEICQREKLTDEEFSAMRGLGYRKTQICIRSDNLHIYAGIPYR